MAKISGGKGVVQIGSVLISSGGITVFKFSTAAAVVASLLLFTPVTKGIKKYEKGEAQSKLQDCSSSSFA